MLRKLQISSLLLLCLATFGNAQELQLAPSVKVQEKQDEGSLTDKASFLVGFNMIQSIKRQGGNVNIEDLMAGMKASKAGEDMQSFIIGYNMMNDMKRQGEALNVDQLIEGIKAAESGEDKKSFVTGFQLIDNMTRQSAELSLDKIAEGAKTASSGGELGMSPEEVQAVMQSFQKLVSDRQMQKMKLKSDENIAAGKAYIAKLKSESADYKELANGVLYRVLKEGDGPMPKDSDKIRVDYHGTFIDGSVFDSTTAPPSGLPPKPAEFMVAEVVPGFSAALKSMRVGSKWKVAIPGRLGYGVQGRGKIGPNQMLIFEIELLGIVPKEN